MDLNSALRHLTALSQLPETKPAGSYNSSRTTAPNNSQGRQQQLSVQDVIHIQRQTALINQAAASTQSSSEAMVQAIRNQRAAASAANGNSRPASHYSGGSSAIAQHRHGVGQGFSQTSYNSTWDRAGDIATGFDANVSYAKTYRR